MPPLAGIADSSTSSAGLTRTDTNSGSSGQQATTSTSGGNDLMPTVKCVLVGDGAVGKTSLLVSYAASECPSDYIPTAFDNYAVVVRVDDKPIRLQLCDTAGQLELGSLRTLCYDNTDVFLVCFSVVRVSSFHAVVTHWLPEIRQLCPSTPVILVGTQCDRRVAVSGAVVSDARAAALADRVGAVAYLPCSAALPLGVKDVFDAAIAVSLRHRGLVAGGGRVPLSDLLRRSTLDANCLLTYNHAARSNDGGKRRWKKLLCCFTR